jgi:hypothetical protein
MRSRCTIFALALGLLSAIAADKVAAPDLSRYPQTDAFRVHTGGHTNSAANLGQTNLLAISAFFSANDRTCLHYSVSESGYARNMRDVYRWAVQAIQEKQLTDAELKSLRSALRELPTESVSPPLERLLVISFRDGTNWITRSYDSDALSRPMRQVYDIIGERFESRKDK